MARRRQVGRIPRSAPDTHVRLFNVVFRGEREVPTDYLVKPGDSLWSIAEQLSGEGQRWIEIAKLNRLTNPNKIIVGQHLHIPALNQGLLLTGQPTKVQTPPL